MLAKGWWIGLVTAGLCLGFGAGCSGERDKGTNRGLDRPKLPTSATKSG
jgi:hypothetical protein